MEKSQKTFAHAKQFVREVSKKCMTDHSGRKDVEIQELASNKHKVHGHRMSLVMVAGAGLRLIFKAHFDRFTVQRISGAGHSEKVVDYMREFCNLMAGKLKTAMEKADLTVGMSLPIATRGFDEIFAVQESSHVIQTEDIWQLRVGEDLVTLSFTLHIDEPEAFEKINKVESPSAVEDDGDLEFL